MIQKITAYLNNTLTPFDRIKHLKNNGKLTIGWCGIFPPYMNGAAAVSYYIVKELLKRTDINLGIIPLNNKINKKMFKEAVFCNINDPKLNVVIFWCLGHEFNTYASKISSQKIAWQTIHHHPTGRPEESQFQDIASADLKIFLTKWAQTTYQQQVIKKKQGKIKYIPFGVDTEQFKPPAQSSLRTDKFQVTFVSRAHYDKGILPFIQTIPIVLEKSPDTLFNIHAPHDPFTPHYQEIQQALETVQEKYPHNVSITAAWLSYPAMKDLYHRTSVLVFPSNNEGFGVPIIEAMSCGIPCIVSDIPPLNELVNPSVGFCVPVQQSDAYHGLAFPNPHAIAEKILLLKNNNKKFQLLQKNTRQHVQQKYSLKSCIDQLITAAKNLNKQGVQHQKETPYSAYQDS